MAAIAQATRGNPGALQRHAAEKYFTIDHLSATLTGLALLASFAATVALSRDRAVQWQYGGIWFTKLEHSRSFYAVHAIEVVSMAGAGLLAFLSHRRTQRTNSFVFSFWLLLAATALMVVRGYSLDDLASKKFAHYSGPSIAVIAMLAFVAIRPTGWKIVRPFLVCLTWILSAAVLVGVATTSISNRSDAVSSLGLYANALNIFSIWLLLANRPENQVGRALQWVPLLVSLVATVLCQTRLYLVITACGLLMYLYHSKTSQGSFLRRALAVGAGGTILAVSTIAIISEAGAGDLLGQSGVAFLARSTDDTRTGQLVSFFDDVPLRDLAVGRGSLATWNWHGIVWDGATDVGYLSLLLFGGLPLLATYVAVHVAPAIRALRKSAGSEASAAGMIVLLWAVRMLSSSYPSTVPEYYLVVLCLGRCVAGGDLRPRRAARMLHEGPLVHQRTAAGGR